MKGCILPFSKKGDLELAMNYRGIILTSIEAKIYNALLCNCIEPKVDNILRKNENCFRRNRSTISQILTIRRIIGVRQKSTGCYIICRLCKGLWFHTQREDGANSTRIRFTKRNHRSHNDSLQKHHDIVAGVLQRDTLAPHLFIICLDYVLRTSMEKIKENGFELTKKRSRR